MSKTIIEGITEEGNVFRPADWAERMSGTLASFRHRHLSYSPLLQPGLKNGIKCIIVDDTMQSTNPDLYQDLLAFAEKNHLKTSKESI